VVGVEGIAAASSYHAPSAAYCPVPNISVTSRLFRNRFIAIPGAAVNAGAAFCDWDLRARVPGAPVSALQRAVFCPSTGSAQLTSIPARPLAFAEHAVNTSGSCCAGAAAVVPQASWQVVRSAAAAVADAHWRLGTAVSATAFARHCRSRARHFVAGDHTTRVELRLRGLPGPGDRRRSRSRLAAFGTTYGPSARIRLREIESVLPAPPAPRKSRHKARPRSGFGGGEKKKKFFVFFFLFFCFFFFCFFVVFLLFFFCLFLFICFFCFFVFCFCLVVCFVRVFYFSLFDLVGFVFLFLL